MRLFEITPPDLVLICSYLLLNTFPGMYGHNVSTTLDPGLNITEEVKFKILRVWCNGMNYWGLCQNDSETRLVCFGEVFRSEFYRLNGDDSFYDYDSGQLGNLLQGIRCGSVRKTDANVRIDTYKISEVSIGQWVFFICILLGCVLLFNLIRRMKQVAFQASIHIEGFVSFNKVPSTLTV